jgi:hypothetical protein
MPQVFIRATMFPIFEPFVTEIMTPRQTDAHIVAFQFTQKINVLIMLQAVEKSHNIVMILIDVLYLSAIFRYRICADIISPAFRDHNRTC